MTALFDALDAHEKQVDDAAAVRAEFEPVAVELMRLREVLEHHGVDMDRVKVHNGAEVVREAIRFLEETIQARDMRHEQAQRWARMNTALFGRIDELKTWNALLRGINEELAEIADLRDNGTGAGEGTP